MMTRFEEMNEPTKSAVAVPAETLFTNGLNEMFYMMNNSDANINVFRLYAQYWAQTTYPDESQYNQASRKNPDNFWRRGFRDALQDLNDSKRVTSQDWEKLGQPKPKGITGWQLLIFAKCIRMRY